MLTNYKNYYMFEDFVKTKKMTLCTADITMHNWYDYYNGVLNLMKDGIETEFLQKTFIS